MSTITNAADIFINMPFAAEIRETARLTETKVYFVGGCVRDTLMGRPVKDVDIVPFGMNYEKFARALAKKTGAFAVPFKDNMRLSKGSDVCDVSKPRGADITADLMMRDFTINSLAVGADGKIYGDRSDLKKGVIRAVHAGAFNDDPLRILRAFRFVSALGFDIDGGTFSLASEKSPLLAETAPERITAELEKTLSGPYASKALPMLEKSGALKTVFPGAEPDFKSPLRLEKYGFPLTAALLAGEKAAEKLILSSKDERTVLYMLTNFKKAAELDNMALREKRAFLWKHYKRAESLLAFTAAKIPGKKKALEECAKLIDGLNAEKAKAVNGTTLKKMGFAPGPLFARIIEDTAEKLALDELNERDIEKYIVKNYGGPQ